MILTHCAVCATELGLSLGKKCGRCSTRYCGPECQVQHWKEGGHDQLCKKIKRSGGAEQYHANNKYTEAVAVAVEACADDTKGETCYICTQALHWKTKEGLVRMCACRGTAGFAHVSCLAEQAKILYAEGEENNLGEKAMVPRWGRWDTCGLCEQQYHGAVLCALGWAVWKTYVGRQEGDWTRLTAMTMLGNGLSAVKHCADALSVGEAELSIRQRLGTSENEMLITQNNLACTYEELGRREEALSLRQEVYSGRVKLNGKEDRETLMAANNYATSLMNLRHYAEARPLMLKTMPVARRVLGESDELTLKTRWNYARVLYRYRGATLDDLREAMATLEDLERTARRVLGGAHPLMKSIAQNLRDARLTLAAREDGVTSVCEAVDAANLLDGS
jgi:hypothetical protein